MSHALPLQLFILLSLLLCAVVVPADDFVELAQSCEYCHNKDGNSSTPDVPIIAGFSFEGFLNTMDVFRDGERIAVEFHKPGEPETVMNEIAKSLRAEDVRSLAEYFSKRPFIAARQNVNTELAKRGEIIHKKILRAMP